MRTPDASTRAPPPPKLQIWPMGRARAEHEPPPAVEPAVVDPSGRAVLLDRGDEPARPAFEVEHLEPAGEAREDRRSAEGRETGEAAGQRHGSGLPV